MRLIIWNNNYNDPALQAHKGWGSGKSKPRQMTSEARGSVAASLRHV